MLKQKIERLHAALEQAVAYSVGDRQIVVVARCSLRMSSLKEKQVITNGAEQRLRIKPSADIVADRRRDLAASS